MPFRKKRSRPQKRLYVDAAAATPLSPLSRRELIRLLSVYGNAGALHREAQEAKSELEKARATIADAIGAYPDELIFTASGTEANNLAIGGILRPLLLEHGELHAITSAVEHQSVLEPLRALEREGLYVTVLPVDSDGFVSPQELREAITEETVFVSIQLVNSEVGTIEPVREIAKEIRKEKQSRTSRSEGKTWPSGPERPSGGSSAELPLYLHTDASQAPLWLPIAVEHLGVDLLTLDAQKVLGPKGVGALYAKRGTALEPMLWGGAQEQGLRAGTPNTPLAGAFAVALADAQNGVEARARKVSLVRDFLMQEIKKMIPDAIFNGPAGGGRVANNINVSIPGLDAEMATVALDAAGIAASTRSACNTGDEEPSHVIKALGVPKELSKTAIRITLLPSASKKDALRIAQALVNIEKKYRTVYT